MSKSRVLRVLNNFEDGTAVWVGEFHKDKYVEHAFTDQCRYDAKVYPPETPGKDGTEISREQAWALIKLWKMAGRAVHGKG